MKETRNRDFREIQVSSSLLVVIFLAVLALGVFIFLLGVSVGKKQVTLSGQSQVAAQVVRDAAEDPTPLNVPGAAADLQKTAPAAGGPSPSGRETSSTPTKTAVTQPKTQSPAAVKPQAASGTGLYYVQVGAFLQKDQALALADRYSRQGYTAVVTDPRPADTQSWYRVRLGGFTNRERAEDLLDGLNAAAGKKTDFRVVRD